MMPYYGEKTPGLRLQNTVKRLQDTVKRLQIPVLPGVHNGVRSLCGGKKTVGKMLNKPQFSMRKREKTV
jgi:hypothetical protein